MDVREVRLDDPLVAPLLEALAGDYAQLYGANDEMATTEPAQFEPPAGTFLAVVDATGIVAGGGFRAHGPGTCEIKRMWTHPDHRRRGLAAAVLHELEARARVAGYATVLLETGPRQPAAAALYAARGYTRIPPYGRYPQALAFELQLS